MSDVAILSQNTDRVSYLTGRGLWFQASDGRYDTISVSIPVNIDIRNFNIDTIPSSRAL